VSSGIYGAAYIERYSERLLRNVLFERRPETTDVASRWRRTSAPDPTGGYFPSVEY
jgi:hypothetical protein